MSDLMTFVNRAEFREWLQEHCLTHAGVWLLFGKAGGPKTIKAGEALEEALCFGWIDGQMQRIDDTAYRKYFSPPPGEQQVVGEKTGRWPSALRSGA